jgi:hypothetical protein
LNKLTETIQIQKPLTQEQKVELLNDIATAYDRIYELEMNIADLDEQKKPLKDAIKREHDNVAQALATKKAGFIPQNVEVTVVYGTNTVNYYDAKTGEKVDERPITEAEQLQLSEHRTDAEKIIRDSEKEE